jgi:hypothetical protein
MLSIGGTGMVAENMSDIPFMDRAWYQAWFDHLAGPAGWTGPPFGPDIDGCYIPLAWFRKFGLRFACLLGNYGPLRDVGVFNAAALPKCAEHFEVKGVGAGLRLGPTSDGSPNIATLLSTLRQRHWHVVSELIGHEWIIDWSEQGFSSYWASLSKKKTSRIDYYHRRMKKQGEVQIEHYHRENPADWTDVFAQLAHVESRAWVAERGEPRFMGKENQSYWRALLESGRFLHALHVWMTYFNGSPVSFLFALDGHRTRYLYANSYDMAVADHSTGSILWKMAFFDATERGLHRVNLGLGNSGYKTAWGAEPASRMMNYICFPPTVRGLLLSRLLLAKSRFQGAASATVSAFRKRHVRRGSEPSARGDSERE